ncbi:hypothetical protein CBF45_11070 [Bordetella sp. J329]|nr:hypothetical protein CBF45_11070 [Bordetella sp. J329]
MMSLLLILRGRQPAALGKGWAARREPEFFSVQQRGRAIVQQSPGAGRASVTMRITPNRRQL